MEMRSGRVAAGADLRNNLPRRDHLPCRDVERRAVGVARVSVNGGVINQNLIAVAVAEIFREDNLPVEERADIRAVFVAEVNARVKFPFARNGMNPPTERRSNGEFNGLNLRGQNYQRENYQCPKFFQT